MPRAILESDVPKFNYFPSPPPVVPDGYSARKGPFTNEEDKIIKGMVENSDKKPFTDWRSLAERLPGRAGKQIRDRWVNHLNPALNLSPFDRDDDLRLKEAYEDIGSKWKDISEQYFQGTRSENQIKNRYHSAAYKKLSDEGFPGDGSPDTAQSKTKQPRQLGKIVWARVLKDDGDDDEEEKESKNESNSTSTPLAKEVDAEKTVKDDELLDKENGDRSSSGESKNQSETTPTEDESKNESNSTSDKDDKPLDKENGSKGLSGESKNQSNSTSTPPTKELDDEKTVKDDKPMDKENRDKGLSGESKNQSETTSTEDESKNESNSTSVIDNKPLDKVNDDKGSSGESKNQSESTSTPPQKEVDGEKTAKDDKPMDKENRDKDSSGESKNQSESTSTPTAMEVDGERTDKEDEPLVSSTKKRKEHPDDSLGSSAKKRKEKKPPTSSQVVAMLLNQQRTQQLGLPLNNQMMNPQMANSQMMNPQMMNQQMMYWGQPPPHLNLMQGMIPPLVQAAQANIAAQRMMMMMGRGTSGTEPNPMPPIPPGNCHQVILTLPPPSMKLGILLDDNTTFGLPELKSVATNSPIRNQIPEVFHRDCCIVSLKSQAIGHVEPKTAQECATLIAKSQEGLTKPVKLEVVLVQTKKTPAPLPYPPPGKKASTKPKGDTYPPKRKQGRKSAEEQYEWNRLKKNVLLDFFSEESRPTMAYFIRQKKLEESIRGSMGRVINSDKRLAQLVDMRDVPARRREAYDIIERILPDTSAEKAEADKAITTALLDFFSDSSWSTLDTFCHEKKLEQKIRGAMGRIIDGDKRLSQLVDKRDEAERRKDAVKIIEKYFPDTSAEQTKFDRKQKTALLEFFSDSSYGSVSSFCEEKKYEATMRAGFVRFVDKDKRLTQLVDQRNVAERREEAFNIIEKLLPMIYTRYSNPVGNEQSKDDASEKSAATSESTTAANAQSKKQAPIFFFTPANMKEVASKLDFEARPRMARDGSKEIAVHDRKSPDELLTLLTFDLLNRVVRGRAISKAERDRVCGHCAKILFYDHGHKKVSGVSNLDKTWDTRLEQAYISGADMSPLHRAYIGQVSYTDKVEKDYPGLLTQLSEYADESIGKDAPFVEKAMFMNEKSMEDAADDPMMPVLKLNKTNLWAWAKQQKGEGVEGLAQSKLEGDLSIDQIEKKHPGLIEELYNFAIEAMGPDASYHILATCMNEKSKEEVEEYPTIPLVTISKITLPNWVKKRGL